MHELERLEQPPIVEVACGIGFSPLASLDPVLVGAWWARDEVRRRFPIRELRDAIADAPPGSDRVVVGRGLPPLRTWLLSDDGAFLLQVQADRFFLNWRWAGSEYPSFRGREGYPGVLDRTLEAFAQLSSFLEEELRQAPTPCRADVLKVDLLNEGDHWANDADLLQMLPSLAPLLHLGPFEHPSFEVQLSEQRAGVDLHFRAGLQGSRGARQVRLQTQAAATVDDGEDPRDTLLRIEQLVDEVFKELIPRQQRDKRFGKKP